MHAAPIQPAVLKGPDVKNGPQKSTLVHPQPKKVPSMAQLVAMVLPSRSPSPKPSTPEAVPTRTEKEMIDTAQPLKSFVAVQSQSQALTPKLTVKDTSSRTPSPAIHGDHGTYSATSRTHLQPYQVSLPPSTGSSAKSSRSVSPYSSPTKVAVSLPIRSRSPTPVIPQYAPPAPPFPPPPPNTPIYAPRPKSLILPQSKLVAILAEQAQYENNEAEQISTKSTQAEEQRPTIEHDRTPSPHSGMVTPPTTPPSSKKAQTTTINEDVQATSILSMTNSRPHSPALPSTTVSLPVHRHVTTIPLSSLQQVEDIPVREDSPSILRPTTPPPMLSTLALAPPPTLANVMTKEMHAPPCKLPSDWKETITRVTRSSAIPNLQEPTQAGFDEALSMLPPIKPTLQALPEGRDDGASAYVNTGAWLEQIEQATTALGLEIHEVEQRRASKIVDVNLSLDDKGKEIALISSSPQIYPSPLEVASQKSTPTSVTKQRITHELPMLGSSNLTKPVGLPPRSRSPIQRSKTPQRIAAVTQPQDNEEDWSLIAPELESLLAGTFFSPPQSADSTSRSHSSGPRKRPKTPRPRVEGREVIQQNMHLGVPQEIPDCAVVTVSPQVVPSELPSSRCISPPPRNQSLGPKKRSPRLDPGHTEYSDTESSHAHSSSSLPRNQALVTKKRSTPTGSDLGHVENNDQESGRTHPSSPLPRNQNSPGTKKRYPPTGSETGHIEYNDQESGVTYSSSPVPKDQVLGTKKSNPPTYSDSGHVAYNDQESSHSHPSSPPSRNQFLSTKKQYPHIGSDSDHIEYNDQEPSHTYPSSPPSTARLLSQSRQTQATTKSPRGHGQHKRLPTPEMTQTFRPPTPPLPSHYKKKRSNDVLPSEPFSAFIKPAVHVIYPDTSTSYGHSMSGDSVLVMAGPKPPPNYRPVYPEVNDDLPPNRGERKRQLAQSPSPVTSLVSLDKEQEKAYETPEALIDCPPAPPKSQRHDVIAQEPSLGHDQYPDFTIQHASRGRYTSAPIGQARAHTLTLPSASSRSRATHTHGHRTERSPSTTSRSRRTQQPHATKAARSLSEKVPVNKNNVQPLARSKSSPLPSSRHHQRRGFWRLFGLWARVFMSKFKTWTSPSPSIDHDY
ncbi:hypothetical protein EW145_g617 [Phellinidium pouzarii]|uniref:Uncharacterized protein n=1 Tax=Phellinidium pouzarii TaxID=167371 RepID=A0A4S4LHN3_9AGAM|nr:hypothetical protein EW145_g617 [Phellinidium pouzarii]